MAIAACDVLVKEEYITRYQKIINKYNDKMVNDFIASDDWRFCSIKLVEVLMLLALIWFMFKVEKNIKQGSMTIYTDNKKVIRDIYNESKTTAFGACDGASAIIEICETIKELKINVYIKYTIGHPKLRKPFVEDTEL